jgi:phosphate transport system substrate-binding protein
MAEADRPSPAGNVIGASVVLGRDRRVWVLVGLLILALLGGSYGLFRSLHSGAPPAHLLVPEGEHLGPRVREDGVFRLAGAGSALPLARALVDGFVADHPGAKIRVHESVGSTAGLRALLDGAVDMGLAERPLSDEERATGVRVVPYALDAVVFATHPSVPVDGLSHEEIAAIYGGRRARWPDGEQVVVFQRPRDDPSQQVAEEQVVGFAEADRKARNAVLWHVFFNTDTLSRMLAHAPGAIALMDLGSGLAENFPLKFLTLDGVAPGEVTVLDGSYPLRLELSMVLRNRSARGLEAQFLRFVFSEKGETIIRDNGYFPIPSEAQ